MCGYRLAKITILEHIMVINPQNIFHYLI